MKFSLSATLVAVFLMAGLPAFADDIKLGADFGPEGWGYRIDYPVDWTKVEPSNYAVVFSGRQGTAAYHTTVSIQNVRTPETKDKIAAVMGELARLEGRIRDETTGLEVLTRNPFVYEKKGSKVTGAQMVAEFAKRGDAFRQWIVILPRTKAPILHVWIFTGPLEDFPQALPTAKAMLDSFEIRGE
ncbi:MAG: hypothetical protein HQL43_08435 [Alphaproteobacteria bacterium]|jgi:hypothetical protein|nr:hypothetical protein [Alphaproteobacteria bacterium]